MNFIAHLFLSRNDEGLMIGNYIGDAVKGKMYLDYDKSIRDGILLHRQIDKFTDDHVSSKAIKKLFIPQYHKYAGVVVDLVYDYFLCENWQRYSPDVSLIEFIDNAHSVLRRNIAVMPPKMQRLYKMMVETKSLRAYSNIMGIKTTLDKLADHKNLPDASECAVKILLANEDFINEKFIVFFNDILLFTELLIEGGFETPVLD